MFHCLYRTGKLQRCGCLGRDHTTTGSSVEVECGQLVRSGRTIEVYDSDAGYKNYDVDSIRRFGNTVEIEATDTETGVKA